MSESDSAAAVDQILARAELRVSEPERARLIRLYPTLLADVRRLRIPEARDAEPAVVFRAD